MQFKKEHLLALLDINIGNNITFGYGQDDAGREYPTKFTPLSNKCIRAYRRLHDYEFIFEYDNKFYVTYYTVGENSLSTVCPFDDSPDEINCREVFKKERVITYYE